MTAKNTRTHREHAHTETQATHIYIYSYMSLASLLRQAAPLLCNILFLRLSPVMLHVQAAAGGRSGARDSYGYVCVSVCVCLVWGRGSCGSVQRAAKMIYTPRKHATGTALRH